MASSTPKPDRVLAGARGWLITDGKAGHESQAIGVADALGLAYDVIRVAPGPLVRLLAPWGPIAAGERPDLPGARLHGPPWPDVAISIGRIAMPYARELRRAAGAATFTVVLQDPHTGPSIADLIWVPAHDRRRGRNVVTTLTSPHRFPPTRLKALRAAAAPAIEALARPRIAVMLGGASRVYRWSGDDCGRLAAALAGLGRAGASFLVTPSRRTGPELVAAVEAATAPFPRILWAGKGENPYARFLATADALVVTGDSISMTSEAAATGRPVLTFTPSGGSAKFRRFHQVMQEAGVSRPLEAVGDALPDWTYPPLDAAAEIAELIRRRWKPD